MFSSYLPPVVCRSVRMSYLRYLCLFMYSGVQHMLCCVFVLFFFVLCSLLCCQFLWRVHFWLLLRYSLMFIYNWFFFSWSNVFETYILFLYFLSYTDILAFQNDGSETNRNASDFTSISMKILNFIILI